MSRPQLVLDRQHLIQMLSDPAFFQECPDFGWLQETALQDADAYRNSRDCCGGNWQFMQPTINAFFLSLRQLSASQPRALAGVRAYLARKKARPLGPILIFYRPANGASLQQFVF